MTDLQSRPDGSVRRARSGLRSTGRTAGPSGRQPTGPVTSRRPAPTRTAAPSGTGPTSRSASGLRAREVPEKRPVPSNRTAGSRTGARGAVAARRIPARPGGWKLLVGIVVTLNLIGTVMVLSASSVLSLQDYGTPWHFFARQIIWLVIGTLVFWVAARTDPSRWRPFARPAMIASILGLLAVLAPGIGRSAGGASRWIGTSFIQIQPSEIAKLTVILFAADLLDRRADVLDDRPNRSAVWYAVGPVVLAFLGIGMLVLMQPDLGTTMVLGCIVLAMIVTVGMPGKPLLGMLAGAFALLLILAKGETYRWKRMTSFLHPLRYRNGDGYQAVQGLAGLSHGSLVGNGIGDSIATWGYLPNAQTDYIFAVIGEETGLVGTVAVTGLFAALAVVGIRVACRCASRYEALLVAGVVAWIVGQAILNIGAVIGILPVTGVPLPFVSFGGTSLVLAMFAVGMVTNVARRS